MAETPSDRLRRARINCGYPTAAAAAQAFNWNPNTYGSNENGNAPFSFKKARVYAARFGVSPEWLYSGTGSGPDSADKPPGASPVGRRVPVVGVVQAGLWREAVQEEAEELLPIDLEGFENARLFALRVAGPSMNLYYAEGARVVVCPAAEIGIRAGDHVVVERERNGEVETTLKEVEQAEDGVYLWPRSTDPRYQTPLHIKTMREADTGPRIVGVVVAHFYKRPQQQRPLIQL